MTVIDPNTFIFNNSVLYIVQRASEPLSPFLFDRIIQKAPKLVNKVVFTKHKQTVQGTYIAMSLCTRNNL